MTAAVKDKSKSTEGQLTLTPAILPELKERKSYPLFWALRDKQQQFVLHYCRGPHRGVTTACYKAAGYKMGKYPGQAAYHLRHTASIEAAIQEIKHSAGLSPDFIVEKILEQTNAPDMADLEPFFNGEKSLDQLRNEGVNTAALQKVQISTDGKGNVTRRAEIANRAQMLRLGADATGMIKQRREVEHKLTLDFANMTPDQVWRVAHAARPVAAIEAPRDAEFTVDGDDRRGIAEPVGLPDRAGVDRVAVAGAVGACKE